MCLSLFRGVITATAVEQANIREFVTSVDPCVNGKHVFFLFLFLFLLLLLFFFFFFFCVPNYISGLHHFG